MLIRAQSAARMSIYVIPAHHVLAWAEIYSKYSLSLLEDPCLRKDEAIKATKALSEHLGHHD
ncbi:hypothetical protein VTH8203_03257 [Vibrio thalassae]|uniref:Uncharacterized protein n=1 Tax=Vibrio thalassae TaxID=1243014 RepID=A0A240EN75_9VIBR|nr:hypothetical protein [Vibrio thalassae]SNX49609.1 hypothetical protein VTH8203_03257 [Vibrio thalassae]